MAGDRSKLCAKEIFSIKHRFLQFNYRLPKFKNTSARESETESGIPKVVILPSFARVA